MQTYIVGNQILQAVRVVQSMKRKVRFVKNNTSRWIATLTCLYNQSLLINNNNDKNKKKRKS